jgi:hypothetical protein
LDVDEKVFLSLVLTLSDNFDWWILILKVNHMPRRKYKLWGVINFTIRTHGLNANFQFIVHVETLNTLSLIFWPNTKISANHPVTNTPCKLNSQYVYSKLYFHHIRKRIVARGQKRSN